MPISDIPEYRNTTNMAKNFERLAWLAPLAKLLGGKGKSIGGSLEKAVAAAKHLREMTNLPDRFNKHYRTRGWIASQWIKHEVMVQSIELAEEGRLDEGEDLLVEANDPEWLRLGLIRLSAVRAFLPRKRLVLLALEDHVGGRYHASVPVFLAQIDGLAWDLAGGSFFDPKTAANLKAANTVAGHPKGLAQLAKRLSRPRGKTSAGVLHLPYRHGILHGRDLGYGTRKVSTKAACALIAMREWAMPVERGTADVEPPLQWIDPDEATWDDVKAGWRDLVAQVRRTQDS